MLVFLHIEKAAGSTLHEIFRNSIKNYYILSPLYGTTEPESHTKHLTKNEFLKIQRLLPLTGGIGGHDVRFFELYGHANDLKVVFLRDPLVRYISHYNYQNKVMKKNWSFEDFANQEYFSNFMCKKLCAKPCSKTAIAYSKYPNVFFGLTEHFDESVVLLKRFASELPKPINIDTRYSRENVNGLSSEYSALKYRYGDLIVEKNKEDQILYDHVRTQFEINLMQQYDLKYELERHRESCVKFEFNKGKIFREKLFRKSYFKLLETAYRKV